jgi:hypothetical protein
VINIEKKLDLAVESLKVLKDWSMALVVVQSGALAVLGGLLKGGEIIIITPWLLASVFFFVASILVAANVIGAIPPIIQRLPEMLERYNDIYKMPNYLGIPLWVLAFTQHVFAAMGLISFVLFLQFQFIQKDPASQANLADLCSTALHIIG